MPLAPAPDAIALAPVKTAAAPFKCGEASVRLPLQGALKRTAARLASEDQLRILAIGSSSTEGVGSSGPTRTYPARLEHELEKRFPYEDVVVRNAGVGGETIGRTYERLLLELERFRPDLVVWQVGTNDALTADLREETFKATLRAGLQAIQSTGADIVVLDQQYFKTVRDPARYERFVAAVEDIAADEKLCLFPRYRLMKAWAVESSGHLESMLASDGFHMNDNGYACVADLLARQIAGIVGDIVAPQTPRIESSANSERR